MTTRISLLSAALALGTIAALPALAQTMTPASPAPSAAVGSGTQGNVKLQANDEHKSKDQAQTKQTHEQVAKNPGAAAKIDGTAKSDAATPAPSGK